MDQENVRRVQAEVCATAKEMAACGLTAGTWGNISGRVDDRWMVITPSGMDYSKLTPDQMVVINMRTCEYQGNLKPSIELPLHVRLLLNRPEVYGVVHTHSPKALAVAVTRRGIPPICDDQVQLLGGDIRCARYTHPGTQEMAESVLEAIEGRFGALIANHGAITLGRTLKEALTGSVVLEKTAQIWIDVQTLGKPAHISEEDCAYYRDFFMNRYGQKA